MIIQIAQLLTQTLGIVISNLRGLTYVCTGRFALIDGLFNTRGRRIKSCTIRTTAIEVHAGDQLNTVLITAPSYRVVLIIGARTSLYIQAGHKGGLRSLLFRTLHSNIFNRGMELRVPLKCHFDRLVDTSG